MPKTKVFGERNLKDCLPSLPLKRRKAKKKIKVFLSKQFYTSLNFTTSLTKHKQQQVSDRCFSVFVQSDIFGPRFSPFLFSCK
jgi:hypothetical protein